MKKSILFCITNDFFSDQRMQRITKTLHRNNYDVSVFGVSKMQTRTLEFDFPITIVQSYFKSGFLFYLEVQLKVLLFCLRNKYDCFGSVDVDTVAPCIVGSRWHNAKCTFDAHEYFEEVPELKNRTIPKWIWTQWAKFWIPFANAHYTVGQCLSEIFTVKYKQPFHVIRNVPIVKSISDAHPPLMGKPYILYQGALNKGRGLEYCIRAMAKIDNLNLIIVGNGDLTKELKNLVQKLNLKDKIFFKGRLNPSFLDNYTCGAYLGLNLLSNDGLSYYFSLANKFFDFVSYGVPIITMKYPEYERLNNEYEVALLIENLNVDLIANEINRLFSDVELHQKLRMNCFRAKKEWNWENESKVLIKVYKQVFAD